MTDQTRRILLQTCFSFLVPVARFLLRAGISYKEFSEVSRAAFVRVAVNEFGLRGRPTNLSRVSVMTGIPRKDVPRVRQVAEEYEKDLRIELSPLGDVLHYWYTDPEYLDATGQPRKLSFSDGGNSFAALVKKRIGDVPAGAIRTELVRAGAIEIQSDGTLGAVRRHLVPESSHEKLATAISYSLRGLAETIAFNTDPLRVGPGRIERFVESGRLTHDEIERVRLVVREKISAYTEELDDIFFQQELQERSVGGSRVGVGIFYCEDLDGA